MLKRLPILFLVLGLIGLAYVQGRRSAVADLTGRPPPLDLDGLAYVIHIPSPPIMENAPKEPHRTLEVYAYVLDGKRVDLKPPPADQSEIWQIVVAHNRVIVFGTEVKP